MLTKQKKISKKEIQEDQLVSTYYNVHEFFENYKTQIYIALGVVLAIVAAILLYQSKQEADHDEATALLAQIYPAYQSGKYEEAINGQPGTNIKGLKEIANGYSNVEPGELATIYLGHCYYNLQKYEEAENAYKEYSGSSNLLKATSFCGIANSLLALNKKEEAANYYKKAASAYKENPANAEYLLKAGINYLATDKKDTAKEVFEQIKKDYANSAEALSVDRYLAKTN